MIDETAREVGADPLELRRRNVIHASDLPYAMPTLLSVDRITPAETLEQAAALVNYMDFRTAQRRAFRDERRLIGIGLALYLEPTAGGSMDPIGSNSVALRIGPGGGATAYLSTGSHGQGVETTMAQIASDELGIPAGEIAIVQGDTGKTPYGRGTGASGTAVITGGALRAACASLRGKGRRIAAHLLKVRSDQVSFEFGQFREPGSGSEMTWVDLARVTYQDKSRLPPGEAVVLEAVGTYKAPPATWSNGCHACTVEIDPATGRVLLLRYVTAEDCGVIINREIVDGQTAGGVAQGVGAALQENVVYDDQGIPRTQSFLDYAIPRAADLVPIAFAHVETPSDTPGGHKGVGQGSAVVSPACLFNAVADALALVGARPPRMPLTAEAIFRSLGSISRPA